MSDNIQIKTETWVETQIQEVVGYTWVCTKCGGEDRAYNYDSVEQASARHLKEAHHILEELNEDSLWDR